MRPSRRSGPPTGSRRRCSALGRAGRGRVARRPRAQGLRRPDAVVARAAEARRGGPRCRHPPRHGPDRRRRVVLRHAPDRAGLEAALLHQRVAPALGADRRPRALPRTRLARTRLARPPFCSARRSPRPACASSGRPRRRASRRREAFPIASLLSPPLTSILRYMDHESDNFTAEILLKHLGASSPAAGRRRPARSSCATSWPSTACRWPASGSPTAPGSRASNRLTAAALVQHAPLARGRAPTSADGFFSSLPVAGAQRDARAPHAAHAPRPAACARRRARHVSRLGALRVSSASATRSRSSRTALRSRTGRRASGQDRFAAILAAN